MKSYSKPMVVPVNGCTEGIYAASGCYIANAYIHQRPEVGRGDYRIQVDGKHFANHTCDEQTLVICFSQEVTYVGSNGTLDSDATGYSLRIKYHYWNNFTDNIGLGDVIVVSEPGLEVVSASLSDGKE